MPASRSEARGLPSRGRCRLAALAALLAAACHTGDPATRPFAIAVSDPAGASLVALPQAGLLVVTGVAQRLDPSTLVVTPSGAAAATIRFDPGGEPVAFPDAVAQGIVRVEIRYDPGSVGPGGVPLRVRGLRVADSAGRYRFFLGEGNIADAQGIPLVPRPLGPEAAGEDVPTLEVVAPGTAFEPARCGDVYYDRLRITGVDHDATLGQHETASVLVPGGEDLPRWQVRHVTSWHRSNLESSRECQGALRSWFQAAGAR